MVALVRRRKPKNKTVTIDHGCNGMLMTPAEFDALEDYEEGWRYELINGVLVVSPIPSEQEADPNEQLGYRLRLYRETHPQGKTLDKTLAERIVITGDNRRRVDRVIWAGLGRMPRAGDTPTIIAEFVSKRRRDRVRDYETKRDEFMAISVKEYWVIDRFMRILTVFTQVLGKLRKRVIHANQIYRTPLLPGFELRLAELFALADDWARQPESDEIDS